MFQKQRLGTWRLAAAIALVAGGWSAPAIAQPAPPAAEPKPPAAILWLAPAVSLAVPALAYAAIPLTGGVSAIVAPALAGGGHLVAGAPGRGVSYSLTGGVAALGAYGVGTRWLGTGGHDAGLQAAVIIGAPFVLLAARDAHREAARRLIVDPPEEPPLPPLTKAHYARLEGGMTYDQALAILGRPGFRVDASKTMGLATETWRWTNPDRSYLELTFQERRLVAKAQRKLKD